MKTFSKLRRRTDKTKSTSEMNTEIGFEPLKIVLGISHLKEDVLDHIDIHKKETSFTVDFKRQD